jgi:hypothetical protein
MRRVPPAVLILLLAAGGAAAAVHRRRRTNRERVSIHYRDGSCVALEAGAPTADRVLAAAREALASAR